MDIILRSEGVDTYLRKEILIKGLNVREAQERAKLPITEKVKDSLAEITKYINGLSDKDRNLFMIEPFQDRPLEILPSSKSYMKELRDGYYQSKIVKPLHIDFIPIE